MNTINYESAGIVCGIDEAGRGPLAGQWWRRSRYFERLYDSAAERFKNCRKNAGKNYFGKSKKRQLPTELELWPGDRFHQYFAGDL